MTLVCTYPARATKSFSVSVTNTSKSAVLVDLYISVFPIGCNMKSDLPYTTLNLMINPGL